jgi:hypothetical protein
VTGAKAGMRVALVTEGGFAALPGLARPVVVSGQAVATAECDELHRLVQAVLDEHADPAVAPSSASACADGRTYCIRIEHDGGHNEIVAGDPAVPPAFGALMRFIRQHGTRDGAA